MRENVNDWVWKQKMRHRLDQEYELECISLYRNCYDYSPEHFYDDIMVFVTKAFIDRNRQLGMENRRGIVQVKMKFGFLTIYYDGGKDPYLDEIINTATKMAQQIKKKIDEQYGRGGWKHRKILHPNKS